MNTKRRLNCYVFGNLIISFLTINMIANPTSKVLVAKTSNTKLNKIYENEITYISTPDTIISSEERSNVVRISNNVSKTESKNYVKPSYNSLTGNNLVNYAKNFLGLRYVHAGNSLVSGTDCSGFTKLIYQEFGISLGRTVASQLNSGMYVSRDDLQPGDLVFYSYGTVASHVAIYMGDGLIIHQSTPRDGVKISSVNIMRYISARRLITSNITSTNENKTSDLSNEIQTNISTDETIIENNVDNTIENNNETIIENPVDDNIVKEEENIIEKDKTTNDQEIISSTDTEKDNDLIIDNNENIETNLIK